MMEHVTTMQKVPWTQTSRHRRIQCSNQKEPAPQSAAATTKLDFLASLIGRRFLPILVGLSVLPLAGCGSTGCCITTRSDYDQHVQYMVFGFGVIRVAKPEQTTAAHVSQARIFGLGVIQDPGTRVGLGFMEGYVVGVPDGAEDVRMEISDDGAGHVSVHATRALLKESSESKDGETK